jgi:aquaporin Z
MKNKGLVKNPSHSVETKILAMECIGAFAVTYIVSWATIFSDIGNVSMNGVALAYAITSLIFMWFAIPISGGHFNPAITIGLLVGKRIDLSSAIFYIGSQFVGAIIAAGFIMIQLNQDIFDKIKEHSVMGIPHPGEFNYEVSAFWGEAIGAFLIMLIYIALVEDSAKHQSQDLGAAAFAFAIYICNMTIGEISGAGLNPARSLAPALVAGVVGKMQFIHLLAPIIGAILAVVLYKVIYVDDDEERKSLITEIHVQEHRKLTTNGDMKATELEMQPNN